MKKENIDSFQKQSVWGIIGIGIVTLTFYFPFWLRRQTKIINRFLPSNKIGTWFFPLSICFTILNFGMIIPEIIINNSPMILLISKLIANIDVLIILIWSFKIRNRINLILEAEKGTNLWFHGFWTFLFQTFYIQFKINKIKEL